MPIAGPWDNDPVIQEASNPWDEDDVISTGEQEIQSRQPSPQMGVPGEGTAPITTPEQEIDSLEKTQRVADEQATRDAWTPTNIAKGASYLPSGFGKGIINAGKNLNATGLAVADSVVEGVTGNDSNMMKDYVQDSPLMEGRNNWEKAGIGIGEATPGAVLGGGIAGAAIKSVAGPITAATTKASKIGRYGGNFMGQEVGASVTSDKSKDTLLVENQNVDPAKNRENILKPNIGIALDDQGDENDEHLKRTINHAQDAMLTGLVAGGVVKTFGPIARHFKNIAVHMNPATWRSLDAQKRQFVEDILKRTTDLGPNATPQEKAAAYKEVADYMSKNSKIVTSFGDDAVGDVDINQDTISVLLNKLDKNDPNQAAVAQELESLRSSARSGGSPDLEVALNAPAKNLDDKLTQFQTTRGGTEAINQTGEALVKSGRDEVNAAQVPLGKAKDDLVNAEADVDQFVAADPTFGPKLEQAKTSGVKLDANKESLDKQTEVVFNAKDAREFDKGVRDDAYNSMPPGTKANMDDPPREVRNPDNPEEILETLPDDSFKASFDEVRDVLPGDITSEIDRLVAGSDGSFKYLNNTIRPRLSGRITDLFAQGKGTEARALIKLRDNITQTQVGRLSEFGDEATINAAKNANKANIEYSGTWNDGIGGELKMNEKINRPKTQPKNFVESGRALVLGTIKDPNRRESVGQLFDILKTKQGGQSEGLIADIALAEGMKDITTDITSSAVKLTDAEIGEKLLKITKPLQEMAASFPPAQAKRIETFLTNVRNKKWNADDIRKEIGVLETAAKDAEAKVYEGTLKDFFKKNYNNTGYDALPNSDAVLKKILSGDQSEVNLADMMKRAESVPGVTKGLEAAWARTAQDMLQNTKDVPLLEENFLKYGKMIFKDKPEIVESIYLLNKAARGVSQVNKARQAGGLDYTKSEKDLGKGTNTVITWVWGVLNPTAARIRTITGDMVKDSGAGRISRQAGDAILANGDEFAKIARQVSKSESKKLSEQQKLTLFRILTQAGLKTYGTETEQALSDGANTVLNYATGQ